MRVYPDMSAKSDKRWETDMTDKNDKDDFTYIPDYFLEEDSSDSSDDAPTLNDFINLMRFRADLGTWFMAYQMASKGETFPCGHNHDFDDIVRMVRNEYGNRIADAFQETINESERERISSLN